MKQKITKIWKNFLAPLCLFLIGMTIILNVSMVVHAQTASGVIDQVGGSTNLPNFEDKSHAQASFEPGAKNISSAILYGLDFLKYAMGTVAVAMIIITGLRLITAAKKIEEVATSQKEQLFYSVIGLVVIIVADQFVKKVFFGEQGEVYGSQTTLIESANTASAQIKGIYSVMDYVAATVAILVIVMAGFRLVTAFGNEEANAKAKKTLMYAVVGLMLIGLSEFIIKDLVFPNQGSTLSNVVKIKELIVNLTNFIAGFVSTIAAIMFIYGGYLYVTAFGNEEATGKAKKIFTGAIIGLFLAMAAFAIVNTVVTLDAKPTGGSQAPASLPTNGTVGP